MACSPLGRGFEQVWTDADGGSDDGADDAEVAPGAPCARARARRARAAPPRGALACCCDGAPRGCQSAAPTWAGAPGAVGSRRAPLGALRGESRISDLKVTTFIHIYWACIWS
jgi:hypothetical protein